VSAETRTGRTGRRTGDSGTREAILAAARQRFAKLGYDRATIRGIASDAGVDPALVHHFFGTKEKLFVAAVRFPFVPTEELAQLGMADRERLGELIVRIALGALENPSTRPPAIALIRSAITNEQAATMMREFVTRAIVGTIATLVDEGEAEYRASLVASQILGLGIARYIVGLEPLAGADVDDLVAAIAPTVQRYLTGEIHGST
jgi:AcrR family transcriptional regulator